MHACMHVISDVRVAGRNLLYEFIMHDACMHGMKDVRAHAVRIHHAVLTVHFTPQVTGPVSLLLFLFGLLLAVLAGIRAALVRRVKSCKCCKGYGIIRCRLCDGQGKVDWRAKFSYSEMCPLCMSKRFVVCPDCGGFHQRRLFTHSNKPEPA